MRTTPSKFRFELASKNGRRAVVSLRLILGASLLILGASTIHAISINEYHRHIQQAVTALDTLAASDETESVNAYHARDVETVHRVRELLRPIETVEWNGTSFDVDNTWMHPELERYVADTTAGRYDLLRRIKERLQALDERMTEVEKPAAGTSSSKAEASRKLAEILQRPEFTQKAAEQSAISRLMKRFLEWFQSLFPKPKPLSPGGAGILSKIAQLVVVLFALAVLAYVAKLFLPRMLRNRGTKKKTKQTARIVLGEKLEPDQSASDLLTDAEALARRGELRAAIRKAYIALLVELGDRKIISLAQHKTNRDYLRAVREVHPLYGNVKQLTDSFEQHWYGLAQATENDWQAFRSGYIQALGR